MIQLSDYEQKSLQKLGETIQSGKWTNAGLVQLIELCGDFLNIKTIPDYAKETGVSYNGVKKFRKIKTIFNVKFVIENT